MQLERTQRPHVVPLTKLVTELASAASAKLRITNPSVAKNVALEGGRGSSVIQSVFGKLPMQAITQRNAPKSYPARGQPVAAQMHFQARFHFVTAAKTLACVEQISGAIFLARSNHCH